MMKADSDLEARLKMLEREQAKQDMELLDLHELEEISRLETKLSQNISDTLPSKTNKKTVYTGKVIDELEDELEHIDEDFTPVETPKTATTLELESEFLHELEEDEEPKNLHGYVICLMFNPKSPSEWTEDAGGGWREKGHGFCFSTPEKAKQRAKELKAKWPEHPLKIIKR